MGEDLSAVVARLEPGQTVGLGGYFQHRHPMAVVREMVRQDRRDLRLVSPLGAVDVDLALWAGLARHLTFAFVSLDAFGLAPNFRRAAEQQHLPLVECGDVTLARSLEAAARRLPWMPARAWLGSDMAPHHPGEAFDAGDGTWLWRAPALALDWAFVHAPCASADGDVALPGQSFDALLLRAARRAVVTCEEVVTADELAERWNGRIVSLPAGAQVVVAPHGAHPTSCYPSYLQDVDALCAYYDDAVAGGPLGPASPHVAPDEATYRERIPAGRLPLLRRSMDVARRVAVHREDAGPDLRDDERAVAAELASPAADLMAVVLGRLIGADDFIGCGAYTPLTLVSAMLAKAGPAPDAFILPISLAGTGTRRRLPVSFSMFEGIALAASTHYPMSDVFGWGEGVGIDFEPVNGLQIDRWGNVNLSVLGPFDRPRFRGPGSAGLDALPLMDQPMIAYVPRHGPDTLVEQVDFVSALGRRPDVRRRYGLSPDGGVETVVTDLCVLRITGDGNPRVTSLHPGVDAATVAARTGFPLVVDDPVAVTPAPTADELARLRRVDPLGIRGLELLTGAQRRRLLPRLAAAELSLFTRGVPEDDR